MATHPALRDNAAGTQLAERSDNPMVQFRSQLEQRTNEFKMVLPAHITPEKLQRTIITAVQSDPDLLTANRQSLMLACMKAAQDGLLPDKREAALVIFKQNTQVNGEWREVKLVQYMPMVYGLRKKILQSGDIADITAKVVYRREVEEGFFIYEEGTEAMLRHKPILIDARPEDVTDEMIVAAYSMATYKDGTKSYEVMRRFEIDQVREKSQTGALFDKRGKPRTPKGPWVDWFAEMAKKTVMRRHAKTLPMSGDILDVEALSESLAARSVTSVLTSVSEEPAVLTAPRRGDAAIHHDAETGEVILTDEQKRQEAELRYDALENQWGAAETPEDRAAIQQLFASWVADMEVQQPDIFEAVQKLYDPGAGDERDAMGFTVDPREKRAQEVIDLINGKASAFAIDQLLKKSAEEMDAMPDELAVAINRAARARKEAIEAEDKAK